MQPPHSCQNPGAQNSTQAICLSPNSSHLWNYKIKTKHKLFAVTCYTYFVPYLNFIHCVHAGIQNMHLFSSSVTYTQRIFAPNICFSTSNSALCFSLDADQITHKHILFIPINMPLWVLPLQLNQFSNISERIKFEKQHWSVFIWQSQFGWGSFSINLQGWKSPCAAVAFMQCISVGV